MVRKGAGIYALRSAKLVSVFRIRYMRRSAVIVCDLLIMPCLAILRGYQRYDACAFALFCTFALGNNLQNTHTKPSSRRQVITKANSRMVVSVPEKCVVDTQ